MLTFALLAAVTAQVEVYAVHGDGPEAVAAIEAACPSHQGCTDVSEGHLYLMRPHGVFPEQDFGEFTSEPPRWWPAARAAEWKSALASCKSILGAPPYSADQMVTRSACARRIANYLWATWLTELKATRVVIVDMSVDSKEVTHVATQGYAFPSTTAVLGKAEFRGRGVPVVRELVKATRELKGMSEPLSLITELERVSAGSVFANQPVVRTMVAGVKACEAAPAKLTIKLGGAIAESVVARWEASAGGKAPGMECSLSETSHDEDFGPGMGKMTIVSEVLTCGKASAAAEVANSPLARVPPVEALSERLVKGLLKKFCP